MLIKRDRIKVQCPKPDCEYTGRGISGLLTIRSIRKKLFVIVYHGKKPGRKDSQILHRIGEYSDGKLGHFYWSSPDAGLNEKIGAELLMARGICIEQTPAPNGPVSVMRNRGFAKSPFSETPTSGNSKGLPETPDIWHSNYQSLQKLLDYLRLHKSGSAQSAETYVSVITRFSKSSGLDLDRMVVLKRRAVETLVQSYCDGLAAKSKQKGGSVRTANNALELLKTFFSCNGFSDQNSKALRLKSYYQLPRVRNVPEYVPTLEEALLMAERSGSKRNRALVLTTVTTGLRNTALRAIQIGDVRKELEQGLEVIMLSVDPSWNLRVSGADKNNIPFYVFLPSITIAAIKDWLKERKQMFGTYDDGDPLFCSTFNGVPIEERGQKLLSMEVVNYVLRRSAYLASIEKWSLVHAHAMRRVFRDVLRSRLVDGDRMDKDDQEFLMGHRLPGSQDHYYDPTKIEKLRSLYSKLNFESVSVSNDRLSTITEIVEGLGVDTKKVLDAAKAKAGRELSYEEARASLLGVFHGAVRNTQAREQRLCNSSEIEPYMLEGWSFKAALPDGRIVIEK